MVPSINCCRIWVNAPPASPACSSLFSALLLSPMRTGHADQESKHSSVSNSLFHLMTCPVSCGCWESCSRVGTACAVSIPSPASSSSVIIYLQNANHKAWGAYPGKKKQLRTIIFVEIMKQAISEWIYGLLGGNSSATHPCEEKRYKSPCQMPGGFAGAHTAPSHSSLSNCSLQSRLCLPAPSSGCQPQPPHTVPQVSFPSWGEVRWFFHTEPAGSSGAGSL